MSALGKQLLDSMAKDQPSSEARRRAALALGIAAAGLPAAPAQAAPAPPSPTWHPYMSWTVATVAAAVVAGGVFLRVHAPAPMEKPRAAIEQAVVLAPRATAPIEPTAAAPIASPAHNATKRPHRATAAPVVVTAEPAAPEESAPAAQPKVEATELSSISIETTLLDAARGAIRQRATHAALELLHRYDEQAPGGMLRAEADALRIEATLQLGDRALATKLADRFFTENSDSALIARVHALLENKN